MEDIFVNFPSSNDVQMMYCTAIHLPLSSLFLTGLCFIGVYSVTNLWFWFDILQCFNIRWDCVNRSRHISKLMMIVWIITITCLAISSMEFIQFWISSKCWVEFVYNQKTDNKNNIDANKKGLNCIISFMWAFLKDLYLINLLLKIQNKFSLKIHFRVNFSWEQKGLSGWLLSK